MTPAEIAADLREAARIVAEGDYVPWLRTYWNVYFGACGAIRTQGARIAFTSEMDGESLPSLYWWPCDEKHRHVRVMALLFAAEAVERP